MSRTPLGPGGNHAGRHQPHGGPARPPRSGARAAGLARGPRPGRGGLDGLLTADELEERPEVAHSARTRGQLAPLTADLPATAEAKDVVRVKQAHSGQVQRRGRWVVPRRLELEVTFCEVLLDFTEAVVTHDTLRIDLAMTGKGLTLITRPGVVVDTDGLRLADCRAKQARVPGTPDVPVTLRVEVVGRKAHGRVVVRPRRRTFRQWLLRRPPGGRA